MKMKKIALAIGLLCSASSVFAHGYVESPASRAYKCKLGQNTGCGPVQYEPQSVEKTSGFPQGSLPPDGQLASAGITTYSQLDKQDSNTWSKTTMKSGTNNFVWYHTAPHKTTNWRYYITKQNWDPNQPLTRNSFELTPFCEVNGYGVAPATRVTHACNVPSRTGYQAVYAVWEIADTSNSFYQIIDLDFGSDGSSGGSDEGTVVDTTWSTVLSGQISGRALNAGDKVIARIFDANGEVTALRTELTIASAAKGAANQWSYDLATAMNSAHAEIHAGVKDSSGAVKPTYGANTVYAKKGSTLKSVVVSYEEQQTPVVIDESLQVTDVKASTLVNGKGTVTFTAAAQGVVTVEARVYNHAGDVVGYTQQKLNNRTKQMTVALSGTAAGHHMLKYYASDAEGTLFAQDVIDLMLEEEPQEESAGAAAYNSKTVYSTRCTSVSYKGNVWQNQWYVNPGQETPGTGGEWGAWRLTGSKNNSCK